MSRFDNRESRPNTTRRLRLKGWDYSMPGFYFITLTTFNRQELFGQPNGDGISLHPEGQMIQQVLLESQDRFSTLTIDCMAVMPDHIHVLFGLGIGLDDPPHQADIIEVMHWIKLVATKRYTKGVKAGHFQPYLQHLWQDGFYDSISFSDKELSAFRKYIAENPQMWKKKDLW